MRLPAKASLSLHRDPRRLSMEPFGLALVIRGPSMQQLGLLPVLVILSVGFVHA